MDADERKRRLRLIAQRRAQGIQAGRRKVAQLPQPDAIRASYARALTDWLAPLGAHVTARLVALIPPDSEPEAKADAKAGGGKRSMSAELKELEKAFGRQLDREVGKLEAVAKKAATRVDDFHRQAFAEQVRNAVGVKLPARIGGKAVEQVVTGFVRENVDLIKTIAPDYFAQLTKVVAENEHRAETMAKLIAERFDVAQSRANLIARDQIGKLYGQINQARQVAAGVTRFIWRTSGDERVRSEHADLDGESFEWDSPPAEGIPGQAINCRCGAEADFSEVAAVAA